MNWQRAPLFLLASAASSVLLVVFILLLTLQERAPEVASPLAPVPAQAELKFPSGFGRLDELVPFSGGVAPVPTDVVPVEHGPEYRDAAWVNSQSPEAFTIQVLAARDEGSVKRFLSEQADRTQYVYFLYPQGDTSWYVVTTGSYPSHELAAGIIGSTDFGTLPAQPFPRRMTVYQEALRALGPAVTAAPGTPSAE